MTSTSSSLLNDWAGYWLLDHGFLRTVFSNRYELAGGLYRVNQPSPGKLRWYRAGLGQVSAQSGGNAALMGGQQMGNAAATGAVNSAYGQMGETNAWANAANQIAQLPWDEINWGGGTKTSGRRVK